MPKWRYIILNLIIDSFNIIKKILNNLKIISRNLMIKMKINSLLFQDSIKLNVSERVYTEPQICCLDNKLKLKID